MIEKKANTSIPINDLIARRWSGRAFDPDRPVLQQHILKLIEAARWSPSCYGDQPWRYIICDKFNDETAWKHALSCLSEGNRSWAVNAPILILSVADSILSKTGKANRWGQYDTGAASMSMCIQATDLGLMVHQMGGFDVEKSRQLFLIPDQFTPMSVIAVGFQLPAEKITGELKNREYAERQRNPLQANFFKGKWGVPVKD